MRERLRKMRRYLDITQQDFADRLGISRSNIAGYETGKSIPGDAVISLICREFNVNEEWLRTGEGEMFTKKTEEEEIADLVYDLLNPKDDAFLEAVLDLMQTYKNLTPASKKIIQEFAISFADKCSKRKGD